jgi:hypothetical protein
MVFPTPSPAKDKHLQLGQGFRLALGDHGQAAQMTLGPGQTKGGPDIRRASVRHTVRHTEAISVDRARRP